MFDPRQEIMCCSDILFRLLLLFPVIRLLWFLVNEVHQLLLQYIFVFCESVLLPSVVEYLWIVVVAFHATFKEANASLVVRFFFKLERPAVLHEFHELSRLIFA